MATGARTTYTDTSLIPESLNPLISMIDWREAALLRLLGVNNESRFKLINWPNTEYSWLEDILNPLSTTMNDSGGISNVDTTMTVASGKGAYFGEGDIIKVEDELMYVSSVSTDTLTISRGFAGTSAASHADSLTVEKVTKARLEGADYDTGYTTTVTRPVNYTQIIDEAVKVTKSQQKITNYGVKDTMAHHIAKLIGGGDGIGSKGKAGTLAILLQKTFYHGQKAAGTATTARAMGGFEEFVTTNVTSLSSGALTLKAIEDLQQSIHDAGGVPDMIICNSWARRKINSFFDGKVYMERTDEEGGQVINRIHSVFGDIEVMYDRFCPTNKLYIVEQDKLGWITFDPFQVVPMASTGSYEVSNVYGEFGFVLMNELAHGYLHTFSTST